MPQLLENTGAVTVADLDAWKSEFEEVCARFEGRWFRTESREHFRQYLRGLLAPLARKNSWTISEFTGERRPTAIQRFINLTPWDADGLRPLCQTGVTHEDKQTLSGTCRARTGSSSQ
jgi:SRSO17 transposase